MDSITSPLASIGLDIGKEFFHVVGLGTDGKIAFRRKIKRLALVETFKRLSPCVVGMQACLSAHFVSEALPPLAQKAGYLCVRVWNAGVALCSQYACNMDLPIGALEGLSCDTRLSKSTV